MIKKSQFQTATRIIKLGNAVIWLKNQKTQFMELTSSQSEAIRYILKKYDETDLTAAELMKSLQLSQSTVAGIIQRLERKGLIYRRTDPNDNRKDIISPTEKGLELEEQLKQKAVETETILLKGMSDNDRKEFNRLLQLALDNINSVREEEKESL